MMCIKDKVMECKEKHSFMFCDRILINCLRCCGQFMKYSSCLTLVVYFVPFVLSDIGWPRRLTFDSIFNDTNYVHLQHKVRPYPLRDAVNYTVLPSGPQVLEEGYNENELDYEDQYRDSRVQEPLLIGFARDPFRYSVPEEDYLKGVRNMNPKTIMSKGENRGKRGVLHLYNMVYCATGCNPASYLGYGCYCGFLGEGRPTDGIDRCCQIHDECYAHLYCPLFTVYLQPYYWRCHRGQPLCALENYNTRHQFISGCAARLCECDRKFAMCVKNYRCPRKRALCRSSPIRLLQNLLLFG